jgi:aminoglycoside phosphotransferase (APT) family kinase protein
VTAEASLRQQIEAFMRRALEARNVRVADLRRLTGGASRETWSLDATIERDDAAPETLALILQHDTRGGTKQLTRALEYRVLQAARDAGVPTPEPFLMGDDSLGGDFFLVRRIAGETLPRRLLRDEAYAAARRALPEQLGRALARVHAIPMDTPGFDALEHPPEGVAVAASSLDKHELMYRGIALDPHPAFELAFRWLRARLEAAPAGARRTVVHGDFRMGNVMFDATGLQAVLDWELTHIGDPAEDLGWVSVRSWRFGGAQPVGGIGTREEFFAAYEDAGGAKVDADWVRFWEVFGNLRWGIICLSQARVYIDGHSKSVELASIGRRTAETEWELLNIMEEP